MDHDGGDPDDPHEGGPRPEVRECCECDRRAAFFTTIDFYCGRHIPDGFEVFRMVPGSCDTCSEPAPFYDESSSYCGRHLPADVFYLTVPRPDCDTCGADAAAESYSVESGFQCRRHHSADQGRTWWIPPEESDDDA